MKKKYKVPAICPTPSIFYVEANNPEEAINQIRTTINRIDTFVLNSEVQVKYAVPVDEDTDPALTEEERYHYNLWLIGEADMFIVTITNYQKSDNTPTTGCDDIFYSLRQALKSIDEYIEECGTKPNAQTYTEFEIRYFNPPVEERRELYSYCQSIFDLSNYLDIPPISTKQI